MPLKNDKDRRPLIAREYFDGGSITPAKIRKLAVDLMLYGSDPTALSLLSGAAASFLISTAKALESGDIVEVKS